MRLRMILAVAMVAAFLASPAIGQLAAPPKELPGFELRQDQAGKPWWYRNIQGWEGYFRPTKETWNHPPIAVMLKSEAPGLFGDLTRKNNFGLILNEVPEAAGFSTGPVGQTGAEDCPDPGPSTPSVEPADDAAGWPWSSRESSALTYLAIGAVVVLAVTLFTVLVAVAVLVVILLRRR